jgi:hypothetical protein
MHAHARNESTYINACWLPTPDAANLRIKLHANLAAIVFLICNVTVLTRNASAQTPSDDTDGPFNENIRHKIHGG